MHREIEIIGTTKFWGDDASKTGYQLKGMILFSKDDEEQYRKLLHAQEEMYAQCGFTKVSRDWIAPRDGDLEDWEGFEGNWYIPIIRDRCMEPPGLGSKTLVRAKITIVPHTTASLQERFLCHGDEIEIIEKGEPT